MPAVRHNYLELMRIAIIPFFLAFFSCGRQTTDNRVNCYFPAKDFLEERTYCYVNQKDTTDRSFWKMKTALSGGDTIFQTTIYNEDRLAEKIIEKIDNGNSKLTSYTLYDKERISECRILESQVYKVDQKEGEEIKWSVRFQDPNTMNSLLMTKTRKLENADKGRQTYSDKLQIEIPGTSKKYEYFVKFVYERGKGLVSYKLIRPGMPTKEFKLTTIK